MRKLSVLLCICVWMKSCTCESSKVTHKSLSTFENVSLRLWIVLCAFLSIRRALKGACFKQLMNCSGLTRPRKKIKCHYTQRVTAVRWDRVLVNSQISQETQKYTSGSTPLLNFHFDSLLLSLLHMFRTKHFLRNQSVISFHVCMEKKFTFPCFDAAFSFYPNITF